MSFCSTLSGVHPGDYQTYRYHVPVSVTNDTPLELPDHRDRGVAAIGRALRERCGVERSVTLLLAVSGGADSAALLLALASLAQRPEHDYELHVGHVEHGLRGEASLDDARVVDGWCSGLSIPCTILPISIAEQEVSNIEAAARQGRYETLTQLAQRLDARALVTGHQQDDHLETVLMALSRGAGPRGMAGLSWRRELTPRIDLIRPMLAVDRTWAERLCNDAGLVWRKDATNFDLTRTRAAVRSGLIPRIKALRPGVGQRLVESAQLWREAAAALEEKAEAVFGERESWDRQELRRHTVGVLAEGLRLALLRCMGGRDADRLSFRKLIVCAEAVRDGEQQPRRFQITAEMEIVVSGEFVGVNRIEADPAREDEADERR